jgi:multisubunit Na+/H+ antiporter MnhF subunit
MGIPFVAVPLVLASLMPLIGRISRRVLPDILTAASLFGLVAAAVLARFIRRGAVLDQLHGA